MGYHNAKPYVESASKQTRYFHASYPCTRSLLHMQRCLYQESGTRVSPTLPPPCLRARGVIKKLTDALPVTLFEARSAERARGFGFSAARDLQQVFIDEAFRHHRYDQIAALSVGAPDLPAKAPVLPQRFGRARRCDD